MMEKVKDEYLKEDPYSVDFNDYFHKKRLEITLNIIKSMPPKSNILDVGCGKGYFTKEFLIKNNTALGIDYSKKAIEFAKNNFSKKGLIFKVNDVNELIKFKKKFDIIIANNLIEHIENVNQFFKDCYKLLNKNGTLIISTPNLFSFKNRTTLFFTNNLKYRHKNHICEYSAIQMKNFCNNNNLELIKIYSQYQIKNKKGYKYRLFNLINYIFEFFNIMSFASTYFYLIKKKEDKSNNE